MGLRARLLALLALTALAGLLPVAAARADVSPVSITSPQPGAFITSAQPTLSGVAGTAPGDGGTVSVAIYAGGGTDSTPVDVITGPVGGGGEFLLSPDVPLPDGLYTVVADQATGSTTAYSAPVSFTIKTRPPALTLWAPRSGATVPGTPTLFGLAGNAAGDLPQVELALYRGEAPRGRPLRWLVATRTGGFWSATLSGRLPLGLVTAVVVQGDSAGHVATVRTTFLLVPAVRIIGGPLDLAENGLLSVPVGCPGPPGGGVAACAGTVTVTTTRRLPGRGRVRLLRKPFSVPVGRQMVVSGYTPGFAARALRRADRQGVEVTVRLTGGSAVTARRSLGGSR